MTENQARQPQGIPVGGQFAAQAHTEPGISLHAQPPVTAASLLAANTEPVTLVWVSYDDRLTPDQINDALAGNWNDVENSVDEAFEEHAWEEARRLAEEEVNAALEEGRFDREWDELDSDDQDEAIQAIRDRDDSDPVTDLLRNTPDQLMRTSLGTPQARLKELRAALGSQLDDGGFEARHDAVAALLQDAGVNPDAPGVREEIEALINEGPYDWHEGVQLDLIFYGPVEDAVARPRSDSETEGNKVLTFARPQLLLIDKWNGSGHEVTLPAPITRTLQRPSEEDSEAPQTGRVYLDQKAGGYSWDDVAGVHKPAYRNNAPTAAWTQNQDAATP